MPVERGRSLSRGFLGGAGAIVLMGIAAVTQPLFASAVSAPVANMSTPRSEHTANYLNTGLVLVAGGRGPAGYLASAELFDRQANGWSSAASMPVARAGHTATLLRDGRVLVAGGRNESGPLSSTEIYDPEPDAWTLAGNLASPRTGHTATMLADGRVMVGGGQGPNGVLASAEIFNPQTGHWLAVAPMRERRYAHTATLLASGDVLVTGGLNQVGTLSSAEIFSPASDRWQPAASMASDRMLHSANLVGDGRVLVAGGESGDPASPTALASVELYDPATNAWSPGPRLSGPRFGQAAVTLCSGRVLIAGGTSPRGLETEQFDYRPNAWVPSPPLLAPRANLTATVLFQLGVCSVLIAGGSGGRAALDSAELFNPTVVAAAGGPPTATILPPAPGWLSLSLLVLILTALALVLLGLRSRQIGPTRLLVTVGFQLSGVLIATWLLLSLARIPVATPANVAGAARPHELQLLDQPLAQVLVLTSARSLALIGLALIWSTFLGLGIAVVKTSLRHRRFLAVGGAAAFLWITPTFVLAILVQEFQAFVAGHTALVVAAGFGDVNGIQLFWAAVVLGLRPAAYFFRHSDQLLNLESALDYVRTAQAKGLAWPQVVSRHMLRAAALPLLSTWSNSLRVMIGSLPLVEFFFGYPGLGRVLILSLGLTYAGPAGRVHGDLAMGLVVMMAVLLITLETAASLLQQRLDPRLPAVRALA